MIHRIFFVLLIACCFYSCKKSKENKLEKVIYSTDSLYSECLKEKQAGADNAYLYDKYHSNIQDLHDQSKLYLDSIGKLLTNKTLSEKEYSEIINSTVPQFKKISVKSEYLKRSGLNLLSKKH